MQNMGKTVLYIYAQERGIFRTKPEFTAGCPDSGNGGVYLEQLSESHYCQSDSEGGRGQQTGVFPVFSHDHQSDAYGIFKSVSPVHGGSPAHVGKSAACGRQ